MLKRAVVQGRIVVTDKDNKFIGDAVSFWKLDEDPSKEGFDKAGFWICERVMCAHTFLASVYLCLYLAGF